MVLLGHYIGCCSSQTMVVQFLSFTKAPGKSMWLVGAELLQTEPGSPAPGCINLGGGIRW